MYFVSYYLQFIASYCFVASYCRYLQRHVGSAYQCIVVHLLPVSLEEPPLGLWVSVAVSYEASSAFAQAVVEG